MLDLYFFVKLSEFYSPARKWKFRQSRCVTCKFLLTINRSAWRFQAKHIGQENHPSSNGCRGITKIYLILQTLLVNTAVVLMINQASRARQTAIFVRLSCQQRRTDQLPCLVTSNDARHARYTCGFPIICLPCSISRKDFTQTMLKQRQRETK